MKKEPVADPGTTAGTSIGALVYKHLVAEDSDPLAPRSAIAFHTRITPCASRMQKGCSRSPERKTLTVGEVRMSESDASFETPITRVLAAAPREVAAILREMFERPPLDISTLKRNTQTHLERLEAAVDTHELLDITTARKVAAQCQALLDEVTTSTDPEHKRLIQVAVRYFIEHDDAESDIDSATGFDDDAEVVALIAREVGVGS